MARALATAESVISLPGFWQSLRPYRYTFTLSPGARGMNSSRKRFSTGVTPNMGLLSSKTQSGICALLPSVPRPRPIRLSSIIAQDGAPEQTVILFVFCSKPRNGLHAPARGRI